MTLPSFWRQAAFSVAESAEILDVPEDTLRTWMAREPTAQYIGSKTGGRVFLSGQDIYFYALVREFAAYGVPIRTAMLCADGIASASTHDLPPEKYIIVRNSGAVSNFKQTNDPTVDDRPALVIPLRVLASTLIERCTATYTRESV